MRVGLVQLTSTDDLAASSKIAVTGTANSSDDELDDLGPRIVYTAGGYDEFDDPAPRIVYTAVGAAAGIAGPSCNSVVDAVAVVSNENCN